MYILRSDTDLIGKVDDFCFCSRRFFSMTKILSVQTFLRKLKKKLVNVNCISTFLKTVKKCEEISRLQGMEDTTKFDDGEIHRAFVNRVSFRNNSFSELKMNTNGRESFIVMHRRREGSNRVILRNDIPVSI